MLPEFTSLDLVAIGVFFAAWIAYQLLFDGRWRRPEAINQQMALLRREWMRKLLLRENRIVDSTLVGHTIHSASFFASTTMLVVAGLIGVLGSADRVFKAVENISLLLGGGQRLFEWKLLLLIAIFIYAFFKFTWALRQFNYFLAVLGSAPDARTISMEAETVLRGQGFDAEAWAVRMAAVLTHAVRQLNAGVRAYYFAFGVLGWFVHPLVFMASTILMVFVLGRRQLASPTAATIREHVHVMAQHDPAARRSTELT